MRETMRYGVTLGLICMIAAGLLAGMNSLTKPKIIAQAYAEELASIKEVMPDAEKFDPVKAAGEVVYYKAYDKDAKLMGVVFKAEGKGYASTIETVVGMKLDNTITAIKVVNQNETPGLGAKVTEPEFVGQFINRNISDLGQVQAITGATISSKAVMDSIKQKAQELSALIQNGQ